MKILSIQTSPNPKSITKSLSNEVLTQIKNKFSNCTVVEKDLSANPVEHLSGLSIHAAYTAPEQRNEDMKKSLALGDQLISEVMESDLIIIGAPMWNFSVPSVLKAYLDQIVRVGVTFKYENGAPVGLLPSNKTVIIVSSRGGVYSEGAYKAFDHQETLVQHIFTFLGIKNIHTITSEGIRAEDPRAEALKASASKIENIIKAL